MKKFLTLFITIVLSISLLTGCSDPIHDDFEHFLNVEMTEVNENYEKLKAEVNTWKDLTDDSALESSLNDVLLPLVDDSLSKLKNINPETEEVQTLKDKYIQVMDAYKDGFKKMLSGLQENDEDIMLERTKSLEKGVELLEEYNTALENLADEVGGDIEY